MSPTTFNCVMNGGNLSTSDTESDLWYGLYISCYNENNLYVCYMDWNWHQGIVFFKTKLVILLQVVVVQLDQIATLHNHHQVQVMVLVWMQYQIIYFRHACIKVDITQQLADMGWNPKYNKSILEILKDNIDFHETTREWHMDCCIQ